MFVRVIERRNDKDDTKSAAKLRTKLGVLTVWIASQQVGLGPVFIANGPVLASDIDILCVQI